MSILVVQLMVKGSGPRVNDVGLLLVVIFIFIKVKKKQKTTHPISRVLMSSCKEESRERNKNAHIVAQILIEFICYSL